MSLFPSLFRSYALLASSRPITMPLKLGRGEVVSCIDELESLPCKGPEAKRRLWEINGPLMRPMKPAMVLDGLYLWVSGLGKCLRAFQSLSSSHVRLFPLEYKARAALQISTLNHPYPKYLGSKPEVVKLGGQSLYYT